MSTPPNGSARKGTCFVIMGFGKKTDFETGHAFNLDRSYYNLIKPAVEAAGLECIRADEIVHSGLIDVPMYRQLLQADVVVADLSTSNRNAIYELGVRHALRPYTTVIIAENQIMKSPFFDLSHIVIRQYEHLGEDVGFSEVKRFGGELTKAIEEIMRTEPKLRGDSPVYRFLERLTPPSLTEELEASIAAAVEPASKSSGKIPATQGAPPAHSELMARVDAAQKKGDWLKAKMLLEEIRAMRKTKAEGADDGPALEDPYILQRLALATYKSAYPSADDALKEARDILNLLNPQVSNDTETLGLWGAVHKRLWDLLKERHHLDQAVRGYERGFYLRNDYYNGINYAYLLNERAASSADLGEAIADFVQARRVREEVLEICKQWLTENSTAAKSEAPAKLAETRYWVLATIAEAQIGLEKGLGQQTLAEALAAAPEDWMKKSTQEQVDKLRLLLVKSPLKNLPTTR